MNTLRLASIASIAVTIWLGTTTVHADPSAQVITRARAFANHPWTNTAANQQATCSSDYYSEFVLGDHYGLPYDSGGYMTLHEFDQGIEIGRGAGSYPEDDVLECTVGLDCSGFTSKAWDIGHFSTSTMDQTTHEITRAELKRGDVVNSPGYHVAMFSHLQPNGRPFFYESIYYGVHATYNMGWAYVADFTPRRHLPDSDNELEVAVGTPDNPIDIAFGPDGMFTDTRNTTEALSDVLDFCGAAPSTAETGPEYVYRVQLPSPGRLVISVQDDAGVDIDVHLYEDLAEGDCVARNDTTVDVQVDCGTYYVVADTWSNGASEFSGAFDLTVDFTPSSASCGQRTGYHYLGGLGAACGFPGNPSLSYCNSNLGATTCVYTGETANDESFCTVECATDSDCTSDFPSGCCVELGGGGSYCMPADLCEPEPTDPEPTGDTGSQDWDVGSEDAEAVNTGANLSPDAAPDPVDTGGTTPDVAPVDSGTTATDTGPDTPEQSTDVGSGAPEDSGVPSNPQGDNDAGPSPNNTASEGPGGGFLNGEGEPTQGSDDGCTIAATSQRSPASLGAFVLTLFLGLVAGTRRRR